MARDSAACVAAGAAEVHCTPRWRGRVAKAWRTVQWTRRSGAVRQACPGTLIGVSTGAWIERDERAPSPRSTAGASSPDYASVNLENPTLRR